VISLFVLEVLICLKFKRLASNKWFRLTQITLSSMMLGFGELIMKLVETEEAKSLEAETM
jgi:hypothetical protein